MSGPVDFMDTERDDFSLSLPQTFLHAADSIHINDCEQAVPKTHQIAPRLILNTASPHPADSSLQGRVSYPAQTDKMEIETDAMDVETVEAENVSPDLLEETINQLNPEQVVQTSVDNFPNLAWKCVEAGLNAEKISNDKLKGFIEEARHIQDKMDKLLDFSTELSALPEDAKEMSDKMKTILADLRQEGIDLWPAEKGTEISKDKIIELKSLASSRTDKLRSDLQILFTTKIQHEIQTIGSIVESLRDILRNNSRLLSTIIGHYAKQ